MNACFSSKQWSLAHSRSMELGQSAQLMGILNVTPDSFSDGGQYISQEQALLRSEHMREQGAAIVDVGGESTRPGANAITGDDERARVLPIIDALAREKNCILSVDTYRAKTALAAVEAGAHIVNDVWGCQKEPDIARVAADTGAGLVIMNTRRDRDVLPDLIEDAKAFLGKSLEIAQKAGVLENQIVLDPGFGFAPTTAHDMPILDRLELLNGLGFPLLVGTSRKRFLGEITGRNAQMRGVATAATSVIARLKGAALFRVHDIPENKDALAVADALIAEGVTT